MLEHYLEHRQFVTIGQGQTPPFVIPDYDISVVPTEPSLRGQWMSTHASIHDAVRIMTNITTGIDLADGDLNDDQFWFMWHDNHSAEHRAFRQALGIT
jgi:hypothetical protein